MYRFGKCLREITMLISNQACLYVHQIRHVHQSIQSDMSVCLSIKSGMSLSPSNQACPSVHQIRHVRLSIRLGMSISPLLLLLLPTKAYGGGSGGGRGGGGTRRGRSKEGCRERNDATLRGRSHRSINLRSVGEEGHEKTCETSSASAPH